MGDAHVSGLVKRNSQLKRRSTLNVPRWIGFSEDDGKGIAEICIHLESRICCQR